MTHATLECNVYLEDATCEARHSQYAFYQTSNAAATDLLKIIFNFSTIKCFVDEVRHQFHY